MDFTQLRDETLGFTRDEYSNQDGDFDMAPMAFLVNAQNEMIVVVIQDVDPFTVLPKLIEKAQAVMMAVIMPSWIKDPETNERTGECVVVNIESPDYSEVWAAKLTRDPVVLEKFEKFEKTEHASGRMTRLLHKVEHTLQ